MNKLPPYYNTAMPRLPSDRKEKEHNHEEDFEREQRRMEFLAEQSFVDKQLEEKDEE